MARYRERWHIETVFGEQVCDNCGEHPSLEMVAILSARDEQRPSTTLCVPCASELLLSLTFIEEQRRERERRGFNEYTGDPYGNPIKPRPATPQENQ